MALQAILIIIFVVVVLGIHEWRTRAKPDNVDPLQWDNHRNGNGLWKIGHKDTE